MGLFDGYFDPQQFNSGGGLLGRLLALQQFPDQYQQNASFNQAAAAPHASSPASKLAPLLSGQLQAYRQSTSANPGAPYAAPSPMPGTQYGTVSTGNSGTGENAPGSTSQAPAQNTMLAQYSLPRSPVGIPLPPLFVPGTPENDAFVHSTIGAVRTIGNAIGNVLNNDNGSRPPAGSRGIDKTPWSGDHTEIKEAVGAKAADDVRISPTGDVWAQKPDESWENHGPADTFTGSGRPSGRQGKDRDRWR
jgi:hypothetical protein